VNFFVADFSVLI